MAHSASPNSILEGLSPVQRSAVESQAQNLLILAGPGTGKTRVLVSKIAHLIQVEGVKPERILAMTFSRKATAEMQDRLNHFGPGLADRVEVNTMHAFCFDLVARQSFRLGFKKVPKLVTQSELELIFRRIARKLPPPPFSKTANLEQAFAQVFELSQLMKDEGLWPEDLLQYAVRKSISSASLLSVEEKDILAEWTYLGDLLNAFQTHCSERGFLDFGDCLAHSIRLLEDFAMVRADAHAQWDAILVDEFQDTNYSQIRLLRALAGPTCRVIAVGDDDQSIYKFRGASYSAFKFLEERFSPLQVVELNETYRLSPQITAASQRLIQANGERRYRPSKTILSKAAEVAAVEVVQFSSYESEAQWVASQIEVLLKSGTAPSEIAVLVRAHAHADLLLAEAQRRGLPLDASVGEKLGEMEVVRDLLALFKLIETPGDSIALLRILDSPFVSLAETDIYSLIRSNRRNAPMLADLEKVDELPLTPDGKVKIQKFVDLLKGFVAHAATQTPSQILLSLLEHTSAILLLLPTREKCIRNLSKFHAQLLAWEKTQAERSLRDLRGALDEILLNGGDVSDGDEGVARNPERVSILTTHASKGLEFENVFILSLVGRRFPSNFHAPVWKLPDELRREDAMTKESHTDEERRLLYVAMTRAKKRLVLTTLDKKGTKPSLFISKDLLSVPARDIAVITIPEDPAITWPTLPPQNHPFRRSDSTAAAPAAPAEIRNPEPLRLSYSQLEKYQECPLAYRFRYDLQIPVPPSTAMMVGQVVHSTLEALFKKLQAAEAGQVEPVSAEELAAIYDKYFNEALDDPLSEAGEGERAIGRLQVMNYFNFYDGKPTAPYATEKKFDLKVGPHTLVGKIDRVDLLDVSGQPKAAKITDFKTGKSKKSDPGFANKSLQLSIYALAGKECFGWNDSELVLHYLSENDFLSTTRTPQQLEETKNEILQIAEKIALRSFDPTPGFQCSRCEYARICPAAAV